MEASEWITAALSGQSRSIARGPNGTTGTPPPPPSTLPPPQNKNGHPFLPVRHGDTVVNLGWGTGFFFFLRGSPGSPGKKKGVDLTDAMWMGHRCSATGQPNGSKASMFFRQLGLIENRQSLPSPAFGVVHKQSPSTRHVIRHSRDGFAKALAVIGEASRSYSVHKSVPWRSLHRRRRESPFLRLLRRHR